MTAATARDRHLDALLSIALEQMDQEENERIAKSLDPQMDADTALRMNQAFESAYQTVDQEKRRNQRKTRAVKAARVLRQAAVVLAAFVILVLAAFPVALAASADFRSRVMKLFVHIDENTGEEYFTIRPEDAPEHVEPDQPVEAPRVWNGDKFPRYIPESFTLSAYDDVLHSVAYSSPSGQRFTFSENLGAMPPVDPPEGSMYILEYIQGGDFPVVEEPIKDGGCRITVTWESGDHWFCLVTENMNRDEALKIADSTANNKVQISFNLNRRSQLIPIGDGVPAWWQGAYYPSDLPEDMKIESFDVHMSVKFVGENNRYVNYVEWKITNETVGAMAFQPDAQVSTISIGENKGTLIRMDGPAGLFLLFEWQAPDALIQMSTGMLSEEEAIRIAESVIPCPGNHSGDILIERDEQGSALPPEEWKGQFFPANVPEGFCLSSVHTTQPNIHLTNPQTFQSVTLQEYRIAPSLASLATATSARITDVNGCPALLIVQSNGLSLYWEITPDMWFSLEAFGMPEETLLQMARSMRKTTPMVQAE